MVLGFLGFGTTEVMSTKSVYAQWIIMLSAIISALLYSAYIYRTPYEPLRFLFLLTNVMVHTIYTYGLYEFHWPYTNLSHY